MVMCIVVGCVSKTDTTKGSGMFGIPSIIYNQGEEMKKKTYENEAREVDFSDKQRQCQIEGYLEGGKSLWLPLHV